MTPTQKAVETRQSNKEKRAQKALDEKRISEAIIKGCLLVLDDDSSSVDQRLEASKILNEVRKGVRG
ncbi:MAG: hypothetical protein J6A59_13390 [Lachnospiraceae bacterium]|nr:hypothetical protein [Lachnospiraceae bacterium]